MKVGTAFTISAFIQHESGIMTAAAVGMQTSSIALKPLISLSKQSFQIYQNTPDHTNIDEYHRHLEEEDEPSCELTLLDCISNTECAACFHNMGEKDIDFTTLAHGTDCDEVIKPLVDKDICSANLMSDKEGEAAFCRTIDSCAVSNSNIPYYYDDDEENNDDEKEEDDRIDCDALTSCDWQGFKAGLVGDGACHEDYYGCYNTALCGYDGGDCCEDTCENKEENLLDCGSDGYYCRDPESPNYLFRTDDDEDGGNEPEQKRCENDDEQGFLLLKYASFGNGWGSASMTIDKKDSTKKGTLYEGTLNDGASAQELICLPKHPDCYDVQLTGGTWGNRVSWQIKPLMEGAPEIASGGAPLKCQFPVGGDECEDTCMGQADEDPSTVTDDEDYDSYEQMEECIDAKCLIQLASCELDYTCYGCMVEDAPAYCYSNYKFNAMVQCTLCQCVPDLENEDGFEEYCESNDKEHDKETGETPECTAEQSRQGVMAAFNYTMCSTVEFSSMFSTDFDNDHFGRLDAFENCATTYTNEAYHGGKTALDCMRILQTAIDSPTDDGDATDPVDAISRMAYELYTDGENFCDCSAQASEDCPLCQGFKNFKTILYESVDACRALDQIDCAAWSEFSTPCMLNMEAKFGNAAFTSETQCQYVHDGCGNAGPFPSFRHLDCDTEIDDKEAWDFYQGFAAGCLKSTNGGEPNYPGRNVPQPVPVSPPSNKSSSIKTAAPTRRYVPVNPVVPDDKSGKDSNKSEKKKSGGFLKGFLKFALFGIVCGAGYWYYRRSREFDYVRFRRARNYGVDGPMIDSSAMDGSTMSFEPPSLPPPPSSYEMNSNFA